MFEPHGVEGGLKGAKGVGLPSGEAVENNLQATKHLTPKAKATIRDPKKCRLSRVDGALV